jgi:hypothetical protein
MRRIGIGGCIVLCLLCAQPVLAAIGASASITGEQQISPGTYEYSLSLTNNGDTPISTFWFGWIIYDLGFTKYVYDLLPSMPTNVQSPSGWVGSGVQDGIDGYYYSAEWYTGTPLQPGQTATGFKFDSPDSPDTINGPGWYFPYNARDSWVYQNIYSTPTGSGANSLLTPAVPEPALLGLVIPGIFMLRRRR